MPKHRRKYGKQAVTLQYQKTCGDDACNKYTQTCKSYGPQNKKAGYSIKQCVDKTIVGAAGMRIIGVPFLGVFMMLLGLGAILLLLKEAFSGFGLGQKIVALLACLMVMLGVLFLWFASGLGASYALVVMVVAMLTLVVLGASDAPFKKFIVGIHVFAFVYVVGIWPALLGNGILSNMTPTTEMSNAVKGYNVGCQDTYMGDYFQDQRNWNSGAQYSNQNPLLNPNIPAAGNGFSGYCARGWLAWENVIAFGLVIEMSFTFVGYIMVTPGFKQ